MNSVATDEDSGDDFDDPDYVWAEAILYFSSILGTYVCNAAHTFDYYCFSKFN